MSAVRRIASFALPIPISIAGLTVLADGESTGKSDVKYDLKISLLESMMFGVSIIILLILNLSQFINICQ